MDEKFSKRRESCVVKTFLCFVFFSQKVHEQLPYVCAAPLLWASIMSHSPRQNLPTTNLINEERKTTQEGQKNPTAFSRSKAGDQLKAISCFFCFALDLQVSDALLQNPFRQCDVYTRPLTCSSKRSVWKKTLPADETSQRRLSWHSEARSREITHLVARWSLPSLIWLADICFHRFLVNRMICIAALILLT